jgi:YHS domain-containing protein
MKTTLGIVTAVATVCVLGLVGCGKQPEPATPASTSTTKSASQPAPTTQTSSLPVYKNKDGQIICPVTGEVIKSVADASGYQDYKGVRYYFCCGMCGPKFKKDPDKYVVRHEVEHM